MANIEITATTGRRVLLKIEQVRTKLRGGHLLPGDDGYDAARKIYNAMIDNRPGIIARCAGVADVIDAVNFARNNGLLVSVRGGGHNVSGNAVCDGELMIDLSPMKGVHVDLDTKTARAEPGVTWGEFDRETQAFGLATTGGLVSTTGIAGLTLGGGLGWLMVNHGLACDNLISVDVLTADGQLRTASASRNEDLFWGLRGGGGNFGVATSFEFALHPVGPMLGGILIHRLDKAAEIIRFYDNFTRTSPDELGTFVGFVTSPEGERVLAIFICYNGAVEEGERILKPLREFGPPLADMVGPMPYVQVQRMMDGAFPAGRPPMLLIASNTFWPSARTPMTTRSEMEVALRSSRTRTTVPSRMSRTIGSSASERAFHASQSLFTLRHTRLTVSLPTAPPNTAPSARRTRRVLVPAR